jgi:hypothetical protein
MFSLEKVCYNKRTKNRGRVQVLVAHAYNPSYSAGGDQEDWGSKLPMANSSQDYLKKFCHIKGLAE